MSTKIVAGTGMTSTFTTGANGTITLNAESNYSINEVDTKVKWINGKTIYRKTVATGVMPNRTRKLVAHGISNLGFIISMSGSAYGNSTYLPIPYADTTAANSLGIYASSTDLIIFTGQDMSYLTTSYVTLYYTKTTD
jgi:hypothetical protein